MTPPSDPPLAPWPVHDAADHEWQQYDTDMIACWEQRCRLAVDALKRVENNNDYLGYDPYYRDIRNEVMDGVNKALARIGPLPAQEGAAIEKLYQESGK